MNASWPKPREARGLRPDLAAFFAIGGTGKDRVDRIDMPGFGVLAELARHGRP